MSELRLTGNEGGMMQDSPACNKLVINNYYKWV